jgi:hypothetical protein
MDSDSRATPVIFWKVPPIQTQAAGQERLSEFEINVILTDPESTLAAFATARHLAHDLPARINLLAFQYVPLPFPLARPPVSVAFTQRFLVDLARRGAQGRFESVVRLYLCRNKRQAIVRALNSHSIVIIGGTGGWRRTKERELGRMLESNGCQVIYALDKNPRTTRARFFRPGSR